MEETVPIQMLTAPVRQTSGVETDVNMVFTGLK